MRSVRSFGAIAFLVASLACGAAVIPPGTTPDQPPPPSISVVTVEVVGPSVAVVTVNGRSWTTREDRTIVEQFAAGSQLTVLVEASGYTPVTVGPFTAIEGHMARIVVPMTSTVTPRAGPVSIVGSSFADTGGPWNALGTSLFWAMWGEKHDPDRLDANLKAIADAGYDYVRILAMVGASSWVDRVIDPFASDYWVTVDRLFARLKRHGLRAQVTVFADAQAMMPRMDDRNRFADLWAARAQQEPDRILYLEAANEYWQNGIDTPAELRALARRLSTQTSVPVAASSPACGSYPEVIETAEQKACVQEWHEIYGTGAADVITMHFDRDVSKADGAWRPVRQPWEMQFGAFETGVRVYSNAEPIGPQSSVAQDDNPERLVMAGVVTWLARGASYTLHTGAGIRGGGQFDVERGRSRDVWQVPGWSVTSAAFKGIRAVLPPMANCSPKNAHWDDAPMLVAPLENVIRAYQTVCGDQFVVTVFGAKHGGATVEMRRGRADLVWYRWDGTKLGEATAGTSTGDGQRLFIGPVNESIVVVGRWR